MILSGILKDPDGQPASAKIKIVADANVNGMVAGNDIEYVIGSTGEYSLTLSNGRYQLYIDTKGIYNRKGTFVVDETTPDGDLETVINFASIVKSDAQMILEQVLAQSAAVELTQVQLDAIVVDVTAAISGSMPVVPTLVSAFTNDTGYITAVTKAMIDALGVNAATVNGLTVETAVPLGAVFTDNDTTYSDAEVKTKYEANANTNAFTDAEKSKLSGLESSKFKGVFASLVALETAFPTGGDGFYADVDGGVGLDVSRYVWDASDSAWVIIAGTSTALTDVQIKTQYENNADTNAFTDAEKSKLTAVEDGATADQTGAEIKLAYEDELDTNAFTDVEKSKLAGVDAGANNYTLPNADTTTVGGIKTRLAGTDLFITDNGTNP